MLFELPDVLRVLTTCRGCAREPATSFATYHTKLAEWKADLRGARAQGNKAVIWGAGSKGVASLNGLEVGDEISYCVDIKLTAV